MRVASGVSLDSPLEFVKVGPPASKIRDRANEMQPKCEVAMASCPCPARARAQDAQHDPGRQNAPTAFTALTTLIEDLPHHSFLAR